ncbi:unnamed protein product [Paramecium octaurelia]|uniref:Tetratricopeptide repeat protein n=1 Tax=Paramecium octaurelia TaxID=43137 RepID=A0A8S1W4C4_PAROT|nr:unnamed protein product [Paramecium octaurelia]
MQSEINKPSIIIIIGDFDMDGSQNQLEDYIQNEKKLLVDSINSIYKNYEPNLILVEKGANKIALDECLKKKITVLTNVKKKVLQRVKLCTNAKFISLSILKQCIERKEQIVGTCEKVFFKQFPKVNSEKGEIQKDSTLCFLKNSSCQKFATIAISGPSEELLSKLKQCFIGCARLGKHQDLESHFITTECSMFKNNLLKSIANQGNFTTFLFEKIPLKELFNIELKYIKINYVIADVNNFNYIKDFSSVEEYKSKHPSQRDKLEEFSMARMCNKPQEKKSVYYHGEDICLGQFIILKIANMDNRCEFCHLPKIAHVSFYYWRQIYLNKSGRVISTNNFLSCQMKMNKEIMYTLQKILLKLFYNPIQIKREKKRRQEQKLIFNVANAIQVQILLNCLAQIQTFPFFRFMQTILMTPPNTNDKQTGQQINCNHQLQRIFTYDESMVKIQVGEVEIIQKIGKKNTFRLKKKELYQRYLNITFQLTQFKKTLSKNVEVDGIEQYSDEKFWQQKFSRTEQISDLQQFTYTLSIQLQDIGDQIKTEMKKFLNKNSIIISLIELDHPSRTNKGHLSGQDDLIHSDSIVGDDIEHQSDQFNKMNRFEEALENYDSAIQKNPEYSDYYTGKAITLRKMNRFEEALENYDSAIQKQPQNSIYKSVKALTLDLMTLIKQAQQIF